MLARLTGSRAEASSTGAGGGVPPVCGRVEAGAEEVGHDAGGVASAGNVTTAVRTAQIIPSTIRAATRRHQPERRDAVGGGRLRAAELDALPLRRTGGCCRSAGPPPAAPAAGPDCRTARCWRGRGPPRCRTGPPWVTSGARRGWSTPRRPSSAAGSASFGSSYHPEGCVMRPAFHARAAADARRAPGRSPGACGDTVVPMSDHSILRTKPVEDVLAQGGDEDDGHRRPRRRIGRSSGASAPLDLMGFGIGIVIGTGIFTLTGIEAKNHAGPGGRDLLRHRRRREPARGALLRRDGLRRARRPAAPTPTPTPRSARCSPGSSAGT